jgi:hypothetical protein
MKSFIFASLLATIVIFSTSSFITNLEDETKFSIRIEGIEKFNSKEGLLVSEFSKMMIEASNKEISIEEFEIILARGSRPVSYPVEVVSGSEFDLTQYSEIAKPGDRFVIELRKVNGIDISKISAEEMLLTIPIK